MTLFDTADLCGPFTNEGLVGAAASVHLTAEDLAALGRAVPRDAVAGERYGNMSSIDA